MKGELGGLVDELRSKLEAEKPLPAWVDNLMLERFLVAREADVGAAEHMVKTTLEWQEKIGLQDILSEWGDAQDVGLDGVPSGWARAPKSARAKLADMIFFGGRLQTARTQDEAPAPIIVLRTGQADFGQMAQDDLFGLVALSWIFLMYDVLISCRAMSIKHGKLVRAAMILDFRGLGVSTVFKYYSFLQVLAKIGKSYFPELNKTVSIVNAPSAVTFLWKCIRPLLPPASQKKVAIFGTSFADGLVNHANVRIEDLPASLGGQAPESEICQAEKVPRGARLVENVVVPLTFLTE